MGGPQRSTVESMEVRPDIAIFAGNAVDTSPMCLGFFAVGTPDVRMVDRTVDRMSDRAAGGSHESGLADRVQIRGTLVARLRRHYRIIRRR